MRHSSSALKGFPMGDPHERNYLVYLPQNYEPKRAEPYPQVYFLAGWSSRGAAYLNDENIFSRPLDKLFDNAILEQKLKPFIGIFPDGTSKLGCSQYLNSPSLGNYLDYICEELTKSVEENFNANPEERVVAGHSSGGFGALVIGSLRPDKFQTISASASDSFFEYSLLKTINTTVIELEKSGGVEIFLETFLNHPNPSQQSASKFETMLTLSMAPCFAPNPKKPPLFGDLFFDIKTGRILPEIWKRYLEWDPIHLIDKHILNIRKLKRIQLEAGLQDEHGLQLGHRQIAERLKHHGVSFQFREYEGGHRGQSWRFVERLQSLL